jgi:hypothetical protein
MRAQHRGYLPNARFVAAESASSRFIGPSSVSKKSGFSIWTRLTGQNAERSSPKISGSDQNARSEGVKWTVTANNAC